MGEHLVCYHGAITWFGRVLPGCINSAIAIGMTVALSFMCAHGDGTGRRLGHDGGKQQTYASDTRTMPGTEMGFWALYMNEDRIDHDGRVLLVFYSKRLMYGDGR